MSRTFHHAAGLAKARNHGEGVATIARRVLAARRPATLPESLTVHARFHCHRWHAICANVTVNDYSARISAAYAAAQEAWGRLLGHGVLLRRIALDRTNDPDVFIARLRAEEGLAS